MLYELICIAAVIALTASFFLALANKWGLIEWLQVHAPNDFLHELFSCRFCVSWWMSVILSIIIAAVAGRWIVLLAPILTTNITARLW